MALLLTKETGGIKLKSYELQATYENVLNTYLNDTIDRNKDIYRFISILNTIEDNCSIALEGKWGSGKTFFVKQTKMILDSFNNFIDSQSNEDLEKVKSCWNQYKNQNEQDLELQPQVSVYYDSWENDNDEDPILSIIYEILQNVNSDYNFKKGINCMKAIGNIVEFFTNSKANLLIDVVKKENLFTELISSREIKSLVDEFLESILAERGNRLVIYIDELDRCKPSYAVKLLERIKHYFTNERITFIFSINIDELQFTIKQYYGEGFNASRYLDRFFDLRISLPPVNLQRYYKSINFNYATYVYDKVSHYVIEYYNFELREISKYLRLTKLAAYEATHGEKYRLAFSDGRAIQFCLLCIVPIMIGLKIHDVTRYRKFIEGKDSTALIEILGSGEVGRSMCQSLLYDNETYESKGVKGNVVKLEDKLDCVYNALFVEKYQKNYELNIGELTFSKIIYETLMRVVSLLSDYGSFV